MEFYFFTSADVPIRFLHEETDSASQCWRQHLVSHVSPFKPCVLFSSTSDSLPKWSVHLVSDTVLTAWISFPSSEEYMLSHFSHVQFCDPMGHGLPGSSVHGILQARILEWVAIPFSSNNLQIRGVRIEE